MPFISAQLQYLFGATSWAGKIFFKYSYNDYFTQRRLKNVVSILMSYFVHSFFFLLLVYFSITFCSIERSICKIELNDDK